MTKDKATNTNQKKDVKKKSSSQKPDKHLKEIKKLKEEREQLQDQLLRKIAEFDNYKKRTERNYYDRILNANEKLITELLPVIDDMERAIDHGEESNDIKSMLEGAGLILKKMLDVFEKQGLKALQCIGEEFDPEQHDALLQMEKQDVESGKIVEEHLKGYTLNGKVIRHSQVIVAK